MNWLKYVIGFLVVIALCTVIWFIRPANDQLNELEVKVNALEEQIGRLYLKDIQTLEKTTEQLLEYNFNLPITEENGKLIEELSTELHTISSNLFYNHPSIHSDQNALIHSEWRHELSKAQRYLKFYGREIQLTKEEAADLYHILQASRFIAKDFGDIVRGNPQSTYDAMHNEEHEMVERINYRLSMKY